LLSASRTSWPRHQTASGLLHRGGRILLEKRAASARVTAGVWDTPGGHLERGERPEAALLRELREELGVVPISFQLAGVQDALDPTARVLYRHHVFLVRRWRGRPVAGEGQSLAWLRIDEALARPDLNPLIRDLILDLRRRELL
jgi:8-oxo-dGTP diphosphatase